MKKASTNVDWVISLGIFLTYILFLFIFLKPGIQQEYNEESLFDVLEQNIYSEANYTVKKIPLYINSDSGGYYKIKCQNDFEDEWDEDNIAIIDNNGGEYQGQSLIFSTTNKKIRMNVYLKNGLNNFFILNSNKETYEGGIDECKEDCTGEPVSCNECNPSIEQVDCIFGTKETFEGLHNESLDTIYDNCNADYENFKKSWNFPMSKEFSLHTKKDLGYENLCNGGSESNQSNIFVKEFKDILLDKYGNKEDVLVNMRIW